MKKYELTSNFKMCSGKKIFQIRALVNLKNGVKVGELGGWIEKEENLSHIGDAWVSGNAKITGDAHVANNAWVSGDACVTDNAWVRDNAWVTGDAQVRDNVQVRDNAHVANNAWVSGDAWVTDNAHVADNACVTDNAWVSGDAWVRNNAWVTGKAHVAGNAWVSKIADLLQITGLGTVHRTTTVYRTKNGIEITRGCFCGNLEQFREQVVKTREGKVRDEYLKFAELIEIYFRL